MAGAGLPIADALFEAGLAKSKGEARRIVAQGGAYVNNRRVARPERRLGPGRPGQRIDPRAPHRKEELRPAAVHQSEGFDALTPVSKKLRIALLIPAVCCWLAGAVLWASIGPRNTCRSSIARRWKPTPPPNSKPPNAWTGRSSTWPATAHLGPLAAVFTAEQINAWLAVLLPKKLPGPRRRSSSIRAWRSIRAESRWPAAIEAPGRPS